jgi:hypothetical protein
MSVCVCILALVIWQAYCVFFVLYCYLYHIFHLISWTTWFLEKNWLYNVCFDCLYNFCMKHFIVPRIIEQDILNLHRLSHKVPIIHVRFNIKLEFLQQVFKNSSEFHISWKFIQWEPSCSMWTGIHDKTSSYLSQFCEHAY